MSPSYHFKSSRRTLPKNKIFGTERDQEVQLKLE